MLVVVSMSCDGGTIDHEFLCGSAYAPHLIAVGRVLLLWVEACHRPIAVVEANLFISGEKPSFNARSMEKLGFNLIVPACA